MEWLVRLIEGLIRGIASAIQPLIENGNLGYLVPFLLLLGATFVALTSTNRAALAGYILGWVFAVAIIGIYQESGGDNLLANLTGNIPRSEIFSPAFFGFLFGFFVLFPVIRTRLTDSQPLIVAVVTGVAVLMLFLTWRASASITVVTSAGMENLIVYRKRYVGIFAVAFGLGVLLHVVISSSNPPTPTKPPPRPPG